MISDVQEFMDKHGFAKRVKLLPGYDHSLFQMGGAMKTFATTLGTSEDPARVRCHHMIEELAETVQAMALGDRIEMADGLIDLLYVVIGTGLKFGLPLEQLWAEVHRSNMTKTFDGSNHPKGETYDPPRIKEVLDGRAM